MATWVWESTKEAESKALLLCGTFCNCKYEHYTQLFDLEPIYIRFLFLSSSLILEVFHPCKTFTQKATNDRFFFSFFSLSLEFSSQIDKQDFFFNFPLGSRKFFLYQRWAQMSIHLLKLVSKREGNCNVMKSGDGFNLMRTIYITKILRLIFH